MKAKQKSQLALQLGLAVVFTYAAIASFHTPSDWIGYLPGFLRHSAKAPDLLKLFSVYEIFLAVWLLSGRYLRYSAGLALLTLAGIVVSNIHLFAITFRDIALIFSAAALFFLAED